MKNFLKSTTSFKRLRLLLTSCVTAGVIGISSASVFAQEVADTSVQAQADVVSIDIVHTNDIHGRAAYTENKDGKGTVVGFEKLATYIGQENPDLVLDAGDTFHGQAFATLKQGKSIADLMALIQYDAMTPGNHDWNYGSARLNDLCTLSKTPVLAGNVYTDEGTQFFGTPTLTKDIDGVKVGVLGVFDQDLKNKTSPKNIQGINFENDAVVATALADNLRKDGCEVVIALTHQDNCEAFVANTKGIDAVIAGHEHIVCDQNYKDAEQKDVRVVETGSQFANVGTLSISYDTKTDKITAIDEKILTAEQSKNLSSDAGVSAKLAEINEQQNLILDEVAGTTGVPLDGRWENVRIGETTLSRVVTQSYLTATGADIAIENGGGIRLSKVLPAGNILFRNIIDTSPFGNYVVTQSIKGSDVKSILEQSIEVGIQNKKAYDEWVATGKNVEWPNNAGSYLQFAGLTVSYDTAKPVGERVISAECGGKPLDMEKAYTIATNSFVCLGSDYAAFKNAPIINEYSACEEIISSFIKTGEENVNKVAQTVGLKDITGTSSSSQSTSSASSASSASSQSTSSQGASSTVIASSTATTSQVTSIAVSTGTNPVTRDNPIIYIAGIGAILSILTLVVMLALVHLRQKKQ